MYIRNSHKRHLHIVSFDIPVPANYGGAIDIYYKIRALHKEGIGIHLHCYQYGRKSAPELSEYCESIHYYPRDISKTNLFRRTPYIVVTRSSEELINNLLHDKHPILFEGLHSTYFLDDKRLRKRRKIVRTHNIEHEYYENLGKVEKNIFKRYYFFNESSKLKRYEDILHYANAIAAISLNDKYYLEKTFRNVETVSAFHPMEDVRIKTGKGDYALYHASLEVGENNQAALFLVNEVFNDIDIPLIIAGNKPSKELKEAVSIYPKIELRTGLDIKTINQLVEDAQINILPTFQATGIKLKLLLALFTGRHCIVNTPMIEKTGLRELCIVKDDPLEIKASVIDYFDKEFEENNIEIRREKLLQNGFTNDSNVKNLINLIYH